MVVHVGDGCLAKSVPFFNMISMASIISDVLSSHSTPSLTFHLSLPPTR